MSRFRGNRCVRELMDFVEETLEPYASRMDRVPGEPHHKVHVFFRDGSDVYVSVAGTPRDFTNAKNKLRQRLQRLLRDKGLQR